MAVKIDQEKCNGCSDCVEACPTQALKVEDGKCKVDPDACADCGSCIPVCPNEAISAD